MEPGHEDREDMLRAATSVDAEPAPQWSPVTKTGKTTERTARARSTERPQWSPVTKTGKTATPVGGEVVGVVAAMEPGHEDREDQCAVSDEVTTVDLPQWSPVTKTGKTSTTRGSTPPTRSCRNGARSRRPGRQH